MKTLDNTELRITIEHCGNRTTCIASHDDSELEEPNDAELFGVGICKVLMHAIPFRSWLPEVLCHAIRHIDGYGVGERGDFPAHQQLLAVARDVLKFDD